MGPGVVRLGQARGKRKGDWAWGGPGSREFPSPIRYPAGPRKCGLACSQAELVTHPSLPTRDHGTAGQLAEAGAMCHPGVPWACWEGKPPKRPNSDLGCHGLSSARSLGVEGGVQRLQGGLGHSADPQLPLSPSSSESCCFTVEATSLTPPQPPSPEPHKPPQLGPLISTSCRGGGGNRQLGSQVLCGKA